jgi:hypothetical protein
MSTPSNKQQMCRGFLVALEKKKKEKFSRVFPGEDSEIRGGQPAWHGNNY